MRLHRVLAWAGIAGLAYAQTKLDLPTQSKNVDFSSAAWTRPAKSGTSLPATCQVGELFFKTNASAGANLYGCTAANTWTSQGQGGSGGGGLPDPSGNAGKVLVSDGAHAAWGATTAGAGLSKTLVGNDAIWSADSASVPFLALNNAFLGVNSFADQQLWSQIASPGNPPSGMMAVYAKTGAGVCWKDSGGTETCGGSSGGGAPTSATYITQTPDSTLSSEQALSALGTGLLKNTGGTGVLSIATGTDLPAHSHTASEVTSGTLPLARGGTGQSTWTASRCVQVNASGTALESTDGACVGGGPAQTGNAGKYLTTDGSNAAWGALTAGSGLSKTVNGNDAALAVDSTAVPFLTQNNTFQGVNSFTERQLWTQISTSSTPSAGTLAVYAKTGAGVCWKDSGGTETCASSGGGGGGRPHGRHLHHADP